jgi:NAD(P)-dependent dehydrogenase (short-subunit alcohol dehydrogenase family)
MPDLFDIEDRVVVVTGASSGLGARFARTLAGRGARVVLAARREERIAGLAAELGSDRALAVATDVADEASVVRLIDTAVARFGRLDVLVNNAGRTHVGPAAEETTAEFRAVIDVNLVGLFTSCREAARIMLPQGKGSIINVASTLGLFGIGRIPQGAYTASKGGVINLSRELAAQWARRGIRVNALCPGWFATEMTSEMFDNERSLRYIERTVPMGRGGEEGELDGMLVFLASDASSYVTGQALVVDGGWSAV